MTKFSQGPLPVSVFGSNLHSGLTSVTIDCPQIYHSYRNGITLGGFIVVLREMCPNLTKLKLVRAKLMVQQPVDDVVGYIVCQLPGLTKLVIQFGLVHGTVTDPNFPRRVVSFVATRNADNT